MRISVYHESYGCGNRCCGHIIDVNDDDSAKVPSRFEHPGDTEGCEDETDREFAERLVRKEFGEEHVKDLDWEDCLIVRD